MVGIELDHGVEPAGPVDVEPLLGHPQMAFDDAAADGLDIRNAGETLEASPRPIADIPLEHGIRRGMHGPIVEGAFGSRLPGRMTPPFGPAVEAYDVRRDMRPCEIGHPEMARLEPREIFGFGVDDSAPGSHTTH